ncbi:NTP transferase domain-containing protein, partial [Komagataeibacter rhaeticus]|uniref:NTP transferase domain-containing protein n=1 Tax=Komagataeibacter rhaeticus TaxID=215221 RepID=UPI0039EB4F3F
MSVDMPRVAMVFAAGLGRRMRPLSERMPKPLLEVAGQPILDHVLDRLEAAGVPEVVVNAHWQPGAIHAALATRAAAGRGPHTTEQVEDSLLETGGSAAAAQRGGTRGGGPGLQRNGGGLLLNRAVSAQR